MCNADKNKVRHAETSSFDKDSTNIKHLTSFFLFLFNYYCSRPLQIRFLCVMYLHVQLYDILSLNNDIIILLLL